jgi:hypothetical protein
MSSPTSGQIAKRCCMTVCLTVFLGSLFWIALVAVDSVSAGPVTTFTGSTTGVFSDPSGGVVTGVGTNSFSWGVGDPSRLHFTGTPFTLTTSTGYLLGSASQANRPFVELGTLDYHNGEISAGTQADNVRLDTSVSLTLPVEAGPAIIPSQLFLINTPNTDGAGHPLPPNEAADIVFLPQTLPPVILTTVGGAPITVLPSGFGKILGPGFSHFDKFFVYEGGSASADLIGQIASPCEPIVRGGVKVVASGPTISATFTPNFGLTIGDALTLCGFDHFNWYQMVTHDPHPPAAKSNPTAALTVPYVDPVLGGYTNQIFGDDFLPFYWNESPDFLDPGRSLRDHTQATTVDFLDIPADFRLKTGEFIGFTTALVGVLPDNTWDALYAWTWTTTFNGTVGGISVRSNTFSEDPGSGTGGVTILQTDLTVDDIPQDLRDLMTRDGARNVSVSVTAVPTAPTLALLLIGFAMMALWRPSHSRRRS